MLQSAPAILDLYLRKTRSKKIIDYRDVIVSKRVLFSKWFPFHTKIQRFEESFQKAPAPFSSRVSVDGRPNCVLKSFGRRVDAA